MWARYFSRVLYARSRKLFSGYGLNFYSGFISVFFLVFFFLVVLLELLGRPWVLAERGLIDLLGVDYHLGFEAGLEAGKAKVGAGGLQGVEKQTGGFVVELAGGQQAHDLHQGDLDGVGVFEEGEFEGG